MVLASLFGYNYTHEFKNRHYTIYAHWSLLGNPWFKRVLNPQPFY